MQGTWEHMNKKQYRPQWLFLILTVAVTFVSFAYIDLLSTQRHGICFWDSLFSGNLLDYYKNCELIYTGNAYYHVDMSAHYDMTLYLIFAVWNLPCYIYEVITGANAQELTVFILWGKALVLIAYVFVIREIVLIRKILNPEGGKKDAGMIAIAGASSALLLIYSVGTGNYDVISLIFMLSGTRMFMKKRRKAAILHFALAFSMKYFAIWCFVPILLLYEKKILKLFEAMLGLVSISLVEKIIFMSNVYLHRQDTVAGNILDGMVGTLLGSSTVKIPGIGPVSLLIPAYFALLLFSYFRKVDDEQNNSEAIRYGFLSWGIFFLLADYSQYWIVFLIPFMVLALSDAMPVWRKKYPKFADLPWIFEGLASAMILIRGAIQYEWVFLTDSGAHLLPYGIAKLFGREPVWGHSFGGMLKHLNTGYPFLPVMMVLTFAFVTVLILICFRASPGSTRAYGEMRETPKQSGEPENEDREWISPGMLRVRMVFELALTLIPLGYYLLMMFAI